MATNTFPLALIPSGWYMTWYMATMAGNSIQATLKDQSYTYVNATSPGGNGNFFLLAQGNSIVKAGGLSLTVNIPQAKLIQIAGGPLVVTSPQSGLTIAAGYTLCYEDDVDNDFNDLFVSIMAWQRSN
jgi:hypothetical protein